VPPRPTEGLNRRLPLPRPGRGSTQARTAEILRVDHAGEYGAVQIYRAQAAVFRAANRPELAADMERMQDQEAVHLARFEALLTRDRIRPTLLLPAWRLAAQALGVGTALLGEKSAHACTEAVESVIAEHYGDQIAEVQDRDPVLAAELTAFRDEEIEHHDHAVEQGAREAVGYRLLGAVIRTGCKAAIRISERI